jgi:single-strand DNA-binding protein
LAGFNKVILVGNLTRNPELRYTPSGTPVASFGLATSRRFKQGDELKEEVCFIDIVVFGKQAEHCGQYLEQGQRRHYRWPAPAAPLGDRRRTETQQT